MYHSIPDDETAASGNVSVDTLRRQLSLLVERGWTLTGVSAALATRALDPTARIVGVTFDDGYADLPRATKILTEIGGSCTAYIVTDFADREAGGDFLGWSAIVELHRQGIEIGSHTCTHRQLDVASDAVVRAELTDSRRRLEDALDARVVSTSYPYGYWSRRVLRTAQAAGYENGCCVGRRTARGDHPLALPRLEPRAGMSDHAFLRMIEHGEPGPGPPFKRLAGPAWRMARHLGARIEAPR